MLDIKERNQLIEENLHLARAATCWFFKDRKRCSPQEFEDAHAEAWYELVLAARCFNPAFEVPFGAFIYRSVCKRLRRKLLKRRYAAKRRPVMVSLSDGLESIISDGVDYFSPVDVEDWLSVLAPKERSYVRRKFVERWRLRDIYREDGRAKQTVRQGINNGLAKLRAEVE